MTKPELIELIKAMLPVGLAVVEECTVAELEAVQAHLEAVKAAEELAELNNSLKSELDAANEKVATTEEKVATLENKVDTLETENTGLKSALSEREEDLLKLNSELSKQAIQAAKSKSVNIDGGNYIINHGISVATAEGFKTYTVQDLLDEKNAAVVKELIEKGSSAVTKL